MSISFGLLEHTMSFGVAAAAAHSLAASLLIVAAISPAHAQPRSASAAVDAVVTDTSLAPLADATAWVFGSNIQVSTGANGRFQIFGIPAGQYTLLVRRLGYAPSSAVIHVAEHDTLRLSFTLERIVTRLDPVTVAAKRASTRMAEFEERRKRGEGQFMTQAEIEKRNEPLTSNLFRTFVSVAVGGTAGTATNRRAGPARGCPFQFFVDDVAVPTPKLDSDLPTPRELAGIEVYANSATIPLQYKTFGGGGFCGVILVWTRVGP
jgi:Carboxypeptidase regulatory-like domain